MFLNFMKTAMRNLVKNKMFAFVNIIGLAVGLAASIMIAMWVFDELSYDRFHENSDRIYRVERDIFYKGQGYFVPVTGAIFGPTIKNDYPEVIEMVRINPYDLSIEDYKGSRFNESVIFADSTFFDVFTFPLASGDEKHALVEPYSLVLSSKSAMKFFGATNVVGKVLLIDFNGKMRSFKVSGVFLPMPENKHFDFEIVASMNTLRDVYSPERWNTWVKNFLYTYVLLDKDADKLALEEKMIPGIVEAKLLPAYEGFFKSNAKTDDRMRLFLRPVTDIHLRADLMWDIQPQGDIGTVYIFAVIALLILLIACFNFMNLSTAIAGSRSLEIGVRKTVGSSKGQIVRQFLGETMITTLISLLFAFALIEIFLPAFNNITDKALSLAIFASPLKFFTLLLIILITGFVSGLYPAFYLSAIKPIEVLKSKYSRSYSKFSFRQVLVVLQFSISIALIIGTVTAFFQLNYLQNKPLGYDKENILSIPVESNYVQDHFHSFRNNLLRNTQVLGVAGSQKVPAEREYSDAAWDTSILDEVFLSRFFSVDFSFLDVYGIEILAGRSFDEKHQSDKNETRYLINETAAKKMGYAKPEDAISESYNSTMITDRMGREDKGEIIGVMKDFHFQSLKNKIEPLTLFFADTNDIGRISIKLVGNFPKETIGFIEDTWNKHFPNIQFTYTFIEDQLKSHYVGEQKMQTILIAFTILAIFIACLGLFGLATFMARQKIKEIGVRKAIGGSVWDIVKLLTKRFSLWVVLSNIIAWPFAYYFLSEWLATFQYSTLLSIWVFIGAGLIALIIALLTVSYRAYRAGSVNPVEALRYE
jgi:putative ABC transport system permease protein